MVISRKALLGSAVAAALAVGSSAAHAEFTNNKIKIGVLNDMSGPYAYLGGKGSVTAAELAVADEGGKIGTAPIEIVVGDHQNKADVGASLAKRWFDADGVDAIVDVPSSSDSVISVSRP